MRRFTSPLAAIAVLAIPACVEAQDELERDMAGFFEVYLGRPVTAREARMLADEMRTYHGATAHQTTSWFAEKGRWLRDDATPWEAASYRHEQITSVVNDEKTGRLHRQLFLEPDPVMVRGRHGKRVMLRSDVIAFANISYFQKGGAPRDRRVTEAEIEHIASELQAVMAERVWAPQQYFGLSATWRAIQDAWDTLDADEREAARVYALKGFRAPFENTSTYHKLFGDIGGFNRATADVFEGSYSLAAQLYAHQRIVDLTQNPGGWGVPGAP